MQPRLDGDILVLAGRVPGFQDGVWGTQSSHKENGWMGREESQVLYWRRKKREGTENLLVEQESGIWLDVLAFRREEFCGDQRRKESLLVGSQCSREMGRSRGPQLGELPAKPRCGAASVIWRFRPGFAAQYSDERERAGGKGKAEAGARAAGMCLLHLT